MKIIDFRNTGTSKIVNWPSWSVLKRLSTHQPSSRIEDCEAQTLLLRSSKPALFITYLLIYWLVSSYLLACYVTVATVATIRQVRWTLPANFWPSRQCPTVSKSKTCLSRRISRVHRRARRIIISSCATSR